MSAAARATRSRRARQALAGMLVLAATLPSAVAGDDLDPSRVAWTNLSYRGRKLMFSIHADIGIDMLPSAGVEGSLVEATLGEGIDPMGSSSALLTLAFRGLGTESVTRLWLRPASGVALQRESLSEKKSRLRRKTYRFTKTGVQVFFHRPAEGEDETRPETWTGGTDRFDDYPEWAGNDLQVSESTALFYVLAVADLEASGDRFQFPVISDENLILVELTVDRLEMIKVDYVLESGGEEVRVKGRVPAIKVLIDAHSLEADSSEAELDFIGMKGNIAIYLDPQTRVPLQISGKVPVAGMAHVRIQRMVLK